MTAPGSQPVDKLTDRDVQMDPTVEVGPAMKTGTSGKPQARDGKPWNPGVPRWTSTSSPEVVRD